MCPRVVDFRAANHTASIKGGLMLRPLLRPLALVATFLALPLSVVADGDSAAREKMIQALEASADGQCAEDIMSPMLLDACEQQITQNKKLLGPLGSIIEANYRGVQDFGNGQKAEAYRVKFQGGTMMWFASLDSEGQLLVLWSNGQVRP